MRFRFVNKNIIILLHFFLKDIIQEAMSIHSKYRRKKSQNPPTPPKLKYHIVQIWQKITRLLKLHSTDGSTYPFRVCVHHNWKYQCDRVEFLESKSNDEILEMMIFLIRHMEKNTILLQFCQWEWDNQTCALNYSVWPVCWP